MNPYKYTYNFRDASRKAALQFWKHYNLHALLLFESCKWCPNVPKSMPRLFAGWYASKDGILLVQWALQCCYFAYIFAIQGSSRHAENMNSACFYHPLTCWVVKDMSANIFDFVDSCNLKVRLTILGKMFHAYAHESWPENVWQVSENLDGQFIRRGYIRRRCDCPVASEHYWKVSCSHPVTLTISLELYENFYLFFKKKTLYIFLRKYTIVFEFGISNNHNSILVKAKWRKREEVLKCT